MLAGKKSTDYTSLFSPHDFEKNDDIILPKSNSIEIIDKTNLTEETKFRLDKINEIENYFHKEINQRKSCSKKLSKYVTVFDYVDKILIISSETTGGVSIC